MNRSGGEHGRLLSPFHVQTRPRLSHFKGENMIQEAKAQPSCSELLANDVILVGSVLTLLLGILTLEKEVNDFYRDGTSG